MKINVQILNDLSFDDKVKYLENLLITAGTVWLLDLLQEEQISGRTNIVDAFRWGRSNIKKDEAASELLKCRPLEFWVSCFLRDFGIRQASYNLNLSGKLIPLEMIIGIKY